MAVVGGEPLHDSVVQMMAQRDGLSSSEAREKVADVLRLAVAARDAAGPSASSELLTEQRREHLLRAARARLWLREHFEAEHQPEDIPPEDPLLAKVKGDIRVFHPRLHVACQLVATPTGIEDRDALFEAAADPNWREQARAVFEPAARRMLRHVPTGDTEACKIMATMMRWMDREADGVSLRVEQAAFDLDACADKDEQGRCLKPQLDPDWVEQVRAAAGPGFLPSFETRFGLHLVYVQEIVPEQDPEGPEAEALARQRAHTPWRAEALEAYFDALAKDRAVKLAEPAEPVEPAP